MMNLHQLEDPPKGKTKKKCNYLPPTDTELWCDLKVTKRLFVISKS